MPNAAPREPLTIKQTALGVGMFTLGILAPFPPVLLIKPLFVVTVSLGVATLISTVLIPKFAITMYVAAFVLLVAGFLVAFVGLAAFRLRPLASFLLGLALSLWAFILYFGLWYAIAYKGAGYK
jgi:hypothetical protein